jgi:fructokinase
MRSFGAIELGGTKTLVAVGESPADLSPIRIPTVGPQETLAAVGDYFSSRQVEAIGVAAFGPLDVNPTSPSYGRLANTPKPGWGGFDLIAGLNEWLSVPIRLDTDVNAAAMGESRWGALRGTSQGAYVTVGTGIGGGLIVGDATLRGFPHPELGHVVVVPLPGDSHPGSCPFHGACLEGMASGPSLIARFGRRPEDLEPSQADRAVELVAGYLAQGLRNLVYAWSPERIVIGGGLSKMAGFHAAVAAGLETQLAGYPRLGLESDFIVPPGLGDMSGLAGALTLAEAG